MSIFSLMKPVPKSFEQPELPHLLRYVHFDDSVTNLSCSLFGMTRDSPSSQDGFMRLRDDIQSLYKILLKE